MKRNIFKTGSYWVYQDSASGIIDSQSVYAYDIQKNVFVLERSTGYYNTWCDMYGDEFDMGITSFRNGAIYDTISFSNHANRVTPSYIQVVFGHRISEDDFYSFPVTNFGYSTTLTNYSAAGRIFPVAYMDISTNNSQIYHVDNVGVVKWVFNDTITGQHTWNLVRYHVINL